MSEKSWPYAIHSDGECDRLERQAALAGIEQHLAFVPEPPPSGMILDAGCGSGSMARLLAAKYPSAKVVGVDLRAEYLAFAKARAESEGLANLSFKQGDIFQLPFADGTFDLVWSKYVLQWLKQPGAAVGEMRRVTRKGGCVVCCNFDGFGLTHWPEDEALLHDIERVFKGLSDPNVGRKMVSYFEAAGLSNVRVNFEPDRLFTTIGQIDPERRRNWETIMTAARAHFAQILGGEDKADQFTRQFLNFYDRLDTASYTALYFVRGDVA